MHSSGYERRNNGDIFANGKSDERDYNNPTVRSAIVNRGTTKQVVDVEVEENYPERVKLSNLHDHKTIL